MINQKKLESGRSMIEMLGVLAIIGVLSVGGIAGYSKAMLKYKVNKTIDLITQLTSNARITFGNQRNYEGLTTPSVIEAYGITPREMYVADQDITSNTAQADGITYQTPWGDNAFLKLAKKSDQDADDKRRAFTIEFRNIPANACSELLLVDWGTAAGSGLIAMQVTTNATASVDMETADNFYDNDCTTVEADGKFCIADGKGFPITPAEAVVACGSNTSNVKWKFY